MSGISISLVRSRQMLDRRLTIFGMPQTALFRTRVEVLEDAYARQETRIAYVDEDARAVVPEES